MTARRACVLTSGRQDYGILRSTLQELQAAPDFDLQLLVGGMHLKERFGHTIDMIRADGIPIQQELDFTGEPPDSVADTARAIELTYTALQEIAPDFMVLLGDRHETLGAGIASVLAAVPIVHIHGGEETIGAVDNSFRHALTKLSHLHLVSSDLHASRVVQMGEDPKHVVVVGPPGLDNLFRPDLASREELATFLGIALDLPIVLVTVHPTTLSEDPAAEFRAISAAMERVPATYIITQPNADARGADVRESWIRWCARRPRVVLVDALGDRMYWSVLRYAAAVLGNSSSGIIEAPAAGVPAIDVGTRQAGREAHPSIVRTAADATAVQSALEEALRRGRVEPQHRHSSAASAVLEALRAWSPPRPPTKQFHRYPA